MCSPAEVAASPGCAPAGAEVLLCFMTFAEDLHQNTKIIFVPDLVTLTASEHKAGLLTCFEMALNQQRTADTNSWWKNKFMAFFNLETYCTLMQIFYQYSGESVPQIDLHLTEQKGGAVPYNSMLVGSEDKWGPVQGTEGSALWKLGIELQWFLFTMQWIPVLWVGLLCVGTMWW